MLPAHKEYKTTEGTTVPSVTQILSILAKPALIPWANKLGLEGKKYHEVTKRAQDIGSLAHYFIHCDITGQERDLSILSDYPLECLDEAEKCFRAYESFKNQHEVVFTHSEVRFVETGIGYIASGGYGGTIDAIGQIRGNPYIFDFKTSSGIYLEHKLQLVAYSQWINRWAGREGGIPKRDESVNMMIVRLSPDGSFEAIPIPEWESWPLRIIFQELCSLWSAIDEYEKEFKKSDSD